jgi:MoxR-like ATPase
MEGTFPLPEAQLDRFLLQVCIQAPGEADLARILSATSGPPAPRAVPAFTRAELLRVCELVRQIPVGSEVVRRAARIVRATHPDEPRAGERVRAAVRWGASPRGGQALLAAGRALAFLSGRLHVSEADLERLAVPVLRHRLVLSWEGEGSGITRDELVREALAR